MWHFSESNVGTLNVSAMKRDLNAMKFFCFFINQSLKQTCCVTMWHQLSSVCSLLQNIFIQKQRDQKMGRIDRLFNVYLVSIFIRVIITGTTARIGTTFLLNVIHVILN